MVDAKVRIVAGPVGCSARLPPVAGGASHHPDNLSDVQKHAYISGQSVCPASRLGQRTPFRAIVGAERQVTYV